MVKNNVTDKETRDKVREAVLKVKQESLPKVNRVEVIDNTGRAYTNYECKFVETQLQDNERTLKVFIS